MNPVQLPERHSEEMLVLPERSYGMTGYDSRV